jgi:hypothetical protein
MTSASSVAQSKEGPQAVASARNSPVPEALLREAFDDVTLIGGGVAVIHHLDNDLIWTLMKRLDRIRVRLLRDLKGLTPLLDLDPTPRTPRVHAAVEELLLSNQSRAGE